MSQALRVARFIPKPARPSVGLARALVRASTYAYFLHEQYHHKVESLAIRLEVIERLPIYTRYDYKVYLPARGTDDQLEEALANASVYRRLPIGFRYTNYHSHALHSTLTIIFEQGRIS